MRRKIARRILYNNSGRARDNKRAYAMYCFAMRYILRFARMQYDINASRRDISYPVRDISRHASDISRPSGHIANSIRNLHGRARARKRAKARGIFRKNYGYKKNKKIFLKNFEKTIDKRKTIKYNHCVNKFSGRYLPRATSY